VEVIQIQVDHREAIEQAEDTSDRTWYGIDGPRRRPRTQDPAPPSAPVNAPPLVEAEPMAVVPQAVPATSTDPATSTHPSRTTVRDRWREESQERSRELAAERPATKEPPGAGAASRELEERFDTLRVAMSTELGRRIDAALARMEGTFEREIQALRTGNREEAKRFRSANGEAFVRIRVADTQELERIRRAVDEGIERLCSLLEGQLERVWSANDVELERIRSAGADRLAEVNDLLLHELERVRAQPPAAARRPWYRRNERSAVD